MSEGKRKKLKSAKELALRGLGLVIILIAVISLYQLGKQAIHLRKEVWFKMAEINLSKYGITGTTEIVYNPSYELLFEERCV